MPLQRAGGEHRTSSGTASPLLPPNFLAIVASNTLAVTLLKKANGRIGGFVVEGPTAGEHNASPRGELQLNEAGEPIYGERDKVDLEKMRELGLPFWLAGGYGTVEKLREALTADATRVQSEPHLPSVPSRACGLSPRGLQDCSGHD